MHDAFLDERELRRLAAPEAPQVAGQPAAGLSLQFWGEHCTECAAPACHDSCDLFVRGPAGRCKRLADGIVVRTELGSGPAPYGLEALFKPWGQLLAVGNTLCLSPAVYRHWARWLPRLGRLSMAVQKMFRFLPARLQWQVADRIRGAGNRLPRLLNRLAVRRGVRPWGFLCQIGNPGPDPVNVEFGLSGFADSQAGRTFRRAASISQGWHTLAVPMAEMERAIDFTRLFRLTLVPIADHPVFLQFGYAGFVQAAQTRAAAARNDERKFKLVVTDLDNTLWDGILLEDPDAAFDLKPGVREALEILDARGILLSVASRNNAADARALLEKLNILHLFLYPRINWEPKSENIRRIVEDLNIGLDTVAFVDDAEFERQEVAAALPEVTVFDAAEWPGLPRQERFDVPVTADSRRRRELYGSEAARRREQSRSGMDYEAFLKSCAIRLKLETLSDANVERAFELVQRTNQLNFSGTRYARADLERIRCEGRLLAVVMHCEDRFGAYGIVGFALLGADAGSVWVEDLMLSCRVQGKRVEHAFFAGLCNAARAAGKTACVCLYRPTPRNGPAARVLADLEFRLEDRREPDGRQRHTVDATKPVDPGPAKLTDNAGLARRLGGKGAHTDVERRIP